VKGIGPKKALRLVQSYGHIEDMPAEIKDALGDISAVRDIYLQPSVVDQYIVEFHEPDIDGVLKFLCKDRQFARDRVASALDRAFLDRDANALIERIV
jgi:flap endonuclease-1